jgi:OOP family OmpA-OmpF porin
MRHPSIAFLLLAFGCKGSASVGTTTPPPAPVVEAPAPVAEPEPEPEPETDPVVKEEPKNLEIQKNVIRLKRGIKIKFATNSAQLEATSNEILDEVASVMSQNERIRVRVEGHTDNTGVADKNLALSESRAASVRDYIVSKGIAADRLESKGCGQDVPVADNATDDGKAENRRVEFVILRRRRTVEPCRLYKPGEGRRKRDGEVTTPPTPPTP